MLPEVSLDKFLNSNDNPNFLFGCIQVVNSS